MPIRGKGAGVAVGGTGVELEAMRVARASEIARDAPDDRSDDGDHMVKTVAEAEATNTTRPMCRKARKRGEEESEEVMWLHQTLRVANSAKTLRVFQALNVPG
jgi:hypothetical protein